MAVARSVADWTPRLVSRGDPAGGLVGGDLCPQQEGGAEQEHEELAQLLERWPFFDHWHCYCHRPEAYDAEHALVVLEFEEEDAV